MTKHVSKFYNEKPEKEWNRLDNPYTNFEFVTTSDLIARYFPKKGEVCDIGCGPGRYSIQLIQKGYKVTMVDLSQELLDIAVCKVKELKISAPERLICSDARKLSMLPTETFDAILQMGPMYHLLKQEDRLNALYEVARLLKNDGVAIISYLNAWGIVRYGLSRFPDHYENITFLRSMTGEVAIPETFERFTECFWSIPPKAMEELSEAGFDVLTYIGCESFASGLKNDINHIHSSNPKAYQNIVQMVRETCELEQYRSTSEHIHFVVKKKKG